MGSIGYCEKDIQDIKKHPIARDRSLIFASSNTFIRKLDV